MNNAEKLENVNFEKEFKSECAEKKRIARGEFARKKGGGKTCRLPSDNLTKKQWEEKCSEVYSVNLKKMMSWEDYGHLDHAFKRQYLTYLIILGGNSATIADMFNLLDSNISAQEIQNEFERLDVQPTLWDNPEEGNENFQKWICDQLTNSESEEKENGVKLPRIKLTDKQKELATPDKFYTALVQYVILNKEHIVRNYNMVQKDTNIILNYINYKSSRDLHTDPTKVHLIINRFKFVNWYYGHPRKSNLFQEELTKNGIKTAYLDEENYTLRIKFYQKGKVPDEFKNPKIAVLAIDIDNIPEPYRKEIYNLLVSRYGEKSMSEIFGYTKEVQKESSDTHEDECTPHVKFQMALLESFKVGGLTELNAVQFDVHGTAHIKGSKEEILAKIERYIDTLGLTELKIEF